MTLSFPVCKEMAASKKRPDSLHDYDIVLKIGPAGFIARLWETAINSLA
jgi:hypothetical protein